MKNSKQSQHDRLDKKRSVKGNREWYGSFLSAPNTSYIMQRSNLKWKGLFELRDNKLGTKIFKTANEESTIKMLNDTYNGLRAHRWQGLRSFNFSYQEYNTK